MSHSRHLSLLDATFLRIETRETPARADAGRAPEPGGI